MYAREITEVMEDRGFSPKQIKQFFNVYPDKGNDYSVEMVDSWSSSTVSSLPVPEYLAASTLLPM